MDTYGTAGERFVEFIVKCKWMYGGIDDGIYDEFVVRYAMG